MVSLGDTEWWRGNQWLRLGQQPQMLGLAARFFEPVGLTDVAGTERFDKGHRKADWCGEDRRKNHRPGRGLSECGERPCDHPSKKEQRDDGEERGSQGQPAEDKRELSVAQI